MPRPLAVRLEQARLGVRSWVDVALDLVLAQACLGCGRPGRALCLDCAEVLHGAPRPVRPDPVPAGLPPTWAIGAYGGALKAALVEHKEHGRRDVRAQLASGLARSVSAALVAAGGDALVVAIPSRRSSVRARGEDPTGALVVAAAREVRGAPRVVPALRHARGVRDQAGLSSAERAANLAGALTVPARHRDVLRARPVVLVDDVLTTGATLAEAARAVRAAGCGPVVAAVLAATQRTSPSRRSDRAQQQSSSHARAGR